jgi:ribonuclease HII
MEDMSSLYPQYLFDKNKGYGTKEHTDAIQKYGICELHRKTFVKNFI